MPYCASRFHTVRRPTVDVKVGSVGVGGTHPLRLQSMTTSDTQGVLDGDIDRFIYAWLRSGSPRHRNKEIQMDE